MNARHMEFFGPDLGRGPFSPHRIETAAVQIATALAQPCAPLTRNTTDFHGHADFIRELADRLAPDWAAQIATSVGDESANNIQTTIRAATGTYSLLDCWLSDSIGGGLTTTAPNSVTFNTGTVLQTVTANKRFLVITPTTGVVTVTVNYTGNNTWYWAISRHARVYYSSSLAFS
uniref:Uncharacterized protein n=1 Tax=uncultured Planctomycetota bacterium TaxID=120965 RepID=A0A5B8KBR3_9BACT|nr:hypothetical protein fos2004AM_00020 [uncultured Planctomycetota bacterium]